MQKLKTTPISLLIREKIIKIQVWLSFCIVWTVFNRRTTWYFQYYMYRLGKTTRSMPFVFRHFIMAAILHVKCDIGSVQMGELVLWWQTDCRKNFLPTQFRSVCGSSGPSLLILCLWNSCKTCKAVLSLP